METSSDIPPAFLDQEPPHWVARGLARLLILLFVAAVVAGIVIQLPETVSSPFVLVPVGGTDPVRAARDGWVVEVRAADGQAVQPGEPLFVLRSDSVGDRSGERETLKVQRDGLRTSRDNARTKYDRQRLADEEELRKLQARTAYLARKIDGTRDHEALQRDLQDKTLSMAQEAVNSLTLEAETRRKAYELAQSSATKATKLYQSNALSELEYLRIRLEVDKTQLESQQSQRELTAARLKVGLITIQNASQRAEGKLTLDQLEADRADNASAQALLRHQMKVREGEFTEQERVFQESLDRGAIRIAALTRELERSSGNEVKIPAPCAGSVLRLRVKSAGTFVRTGDVLCELAGAGERLQAELAVPPSSMGRIQAGQRVKLLYDAFPYQRHGVRYATVRWVSPASVIVQDGPAFRVLADPDEAAIPVASEPRPLLAGMGGRALVVVGRRALISYAFEPLRQLRENLATPPPQPGGDSDR
jgi:multidrug efflux pump subunit AcrA (membrane-fusion protein)